MSDDFKWTYSETVKEHFVNPKNILEDDASFEADGKGIVGNVKCGDQMMMVIKVDRENKTISDCKWKTYGCASAIASTSILSEMVIGMPLDEAYKLSPKDVAKKLDGLPENKIHCSVLGDKALRSAIDDYYTRSNQGEKIVRDKTIVICQCMNVTDHEIEESVLEGARTYLELQEHTKIGTVCGQCKDESIKLLKEYIKKHFE
ncbi:MAG: iron-sulfur cluster assembly scaffold protein [Candidatus Omnitrophica bacterium]|nr:iron-sulfur cluster assembly scaffold protein [Candidatus Omnitrophota bacterium]MBU1997447.1 iron-sulfur cluster assembly scaffold protein [Candidatus Omnitrophota bacterium]MBU4334487.1 iron-sulfur cluster assembly scaffold protein [Candidatus Omnitrophota bacterium]